MAYGSIADIYLLGYIPKEDLDALDAEEVDRIPAMFDAESDEFDLYLIPKYGTSIPEASKGYKAIKRAVVRLVVFELYIMRGFSSIPEGSEVAKQIIASAEHARKLRDDLRDGIAQLDMKTDATPSKLEAGAVCRQAASPNQFAYGCKRW